MNFLAHAYLSGDDEKILVGNFIGDFVKGRQDVQRFEHGIARGISLHRSIDEFTDRHPVVGNTKKKLRGKYRHYAGVVADVFYDHYLAVNWKTYHHRPLEEFADSVYSTIKKHDDILPTGVRYMLPYMVQGNWLVSYSRIDGIHRALSGMARRTSFESHMELAADDLRQHYDEFHAHFQEFFPELKVYCEKLIEKI
jgi:acyl carrier protein phosphodiesterase